MDHDYKLLVVDDDITFLKMVKKWLMDKYQVTIVKSGMQAIKYIKGHRPDLILLDYDNMCAAYGRCFFFTVAGMA